MDIRNARVVITGASQGLGSALARELGRAGAKLVLVARGEEALEAVAHAVRTEGGEAHAFAADVSDKNDVYAVVGAASALVGPIDVVIHNASTLGPVPLSLLLDTACEDLEQVLATNLIGPFRITKAVAGGMILRRRGTVVFVSSDASTNAYARWGSYGVSKAALDHLARIWAAELEGTGVRVFSVDPGEMNTKMHADALPESDPSTLASPAEVAAKIASMLRETARIPSGARLEAASWSSK